MKVTKLTPNLAVRNIKETVSFYQSHLDFSLIMAVPETQDGMDQELINTKEYVYALMEKDGVEIMFQRTDSFKEDLSLTQHVEIGASVSFYMEIDGLDELQTSLKNSQVTLSEIKTTWYGMRELYLRDLNGYILGFAEKQAGKKI